MKTIKYLIVSVCLCGGLSACNDFFDTIPNDQLSPATFWKTEADVINAVTACYENWNNPATGSSDIFLLIVCRTYPIVLLGLVLIRMCQTALHHRLLL